MSDDPWTITIPRATALFGLSRSELYRRLAAGDIAAVKNGTRTLIVFESIRKYIKELPAAQFRVPKSNVSVSDRYSFSRENI